MADVNGQRTVISLPAGEDLTGLVGYGVHFDSATVSAADAEGDACGVLLSDGTTGELVSVCVHGPCKLYLGEAVSTSQMGGMSGLKCEANGTFQLWDANGDNLCAFTLESGAINTMVDGFFMNPAPIGEVHT